MNEKKNNKNEKHLLSIQKIMHLAPWVAVGAVIITFIITIIQLMITR